MINSLVDILKTLFEKIQSIFVRQYSVTFSSKNLHQTSYLSGTRSIVFMSSSVRCRHLMIYCSKSRAFPSMNSDFLFEKPLLDIVVPIRNYNVEDIVSWCFSLISTFIDLVRKFNEFGLIVRKTFIRHRRNDLVPSRACWWKKWSEMLEVGPLSFQAERNKLES
jgi:hypothetical protein